MNKDKRIRCIYSNKVIDKSKEAILIKYIQAYLKSNNKIIINKTDVIDE